MQTYQLVTAYVVIGAVVALGVGAWYMRRPRVGLAAGAVAAVGLIVVTAMGQIDPSDCSNGLEAVDQSDEQDTVTALSQDGNTLVVIRGTTVRVVTITDDTSATMTLSALPTFD